MRPKRRVGSQPISQPTGSNAREVKLPTGPERLTRPSASTLDAILGQPFCILDNGFVRVVDYMGDDAAIVQAARVSYGAGTKHVHGDRGLIRYLMRHSHTTPFEMCEIKLHVRVPMDTWRQWIRHRTANVNEYSTRYSVAIDAAQRTAPNEWRMQSAAIRQGSTGHLPAAVGKRLSANEKQLQLKAREAYEALIAAGVAREQARKDLPLSTYTEAYWKIDLHNLLHFLNLRMDMHAQQEIRAYATTIGKEIVARWVPVTWEAFLDYRRYATQLSRVETEIIVTLVSNDFERARNLAATYGLLNLDADGNLAPNRERTELETKLRAFGFKPPWG
ncbi:MAG: FAD-dependent thymidylate synthase [Burkholderiales bacterium]|nr:FAD-dependent thymidylate synthase [Burkholderiales bacterium]